MGGKQKRSQQMPRWNASSVWRDVSGLRSPSRMITDVTAFLKSVIHKVFQFLHLNFKKITCSCTLIKDNHNSLWEMWSILHHGSLFVVQLTHINSVYHVYYSVFSRRCCLLCLSLLYCYFLIFMTCLRALNGTHMLLLLWVIHLACNKWFIVTP